MFLVAILLDSPLVVSASLPHGHLSQVQPDQSNGSPLALLSSPAGIWAFTDGHYLPANMSTRGEIMSFILTNPGVYLREISEDLGLSMGAVQYHIWVLTRNGEIEECRSGRYRRFFGASRYEDVERTVMSLLRQKTAGRILVALLGDQPVTHLRLASFLGVSSQALSWQMKRLKQTGMVETCPTGQQGRWAYRLSDSARSLVRAIAPKVEAGSVLATAPPVR